MRETEIREITGPAQAPEPDTVTLKGGGRTHEVPIGQQRTVSVRVTKGYPVPKRRASGIYQSGSILTVVFGADMILTTIEVGENLFEALHMVVVSKGDGSSDIPRSFLYAFGTEGRPRPAVTIARPVSAAATDWTIMIDEPKSMRE